MSLLQQIGQSVGSFLASKRGAANGFAATDANNHLLAAHLPSQVLTRDADGKIAVADLPATVMRFQHDFDASLGVAPVTSSADNCGWVWRVSMPGTVLGVNYQIGDYLISTGSGFAHLSGGNGGEQGTLSEFTAALDAGFQGG